MQNMQKCWKTNRFFSDFARSGVWCTVKFWMKKLLKNEIEYHHWFGFDFGLIFGPFLEPKSVQNGFQSGFGRALIEDRDSKLKTEAVESSGSDQKTCFRAPWGEGTGRGETSWHHTPANPVTSTGVGGSLCVCARWKWYASQVQVEAWHPGFAGMPLTLEM